MSDRYIEVDGVPVAEPDLLTWARWMETAERRVVREVVIPGVEVSTVFLGTDLSFGLGPPLLYETMVFGQGNPLDEEQERYSTREEALQGHVAMVARVLNAAKA